MDNAFPWIIPNWPAPSNVKALTTLRHGGASRYAGVSYSGVSQPPYDTFNLATHVGDDPAAVLENHRLLREWAELSSEPVWLNQVHGKKVIVLDELKNDPISAPSPYSKLSERIEADASISFKPNHVCAVMTADCLPVILCDQAGTRVAAVHAGWKGFAAGVIEETVQKLNCDPKTLMAWMGPAIGSLSFEVGIDVKNAFSQPGDETAFQEIATEKWKADLYRLATLRMNKLGITSIFGGGYCTFKEKDRFFSYRRDGAASGRMATLIWLV